MQKLTRREILEALKRQGVWEMSRIKGETRRFEHYWEERMALPDCEVDASVFTCG